jgi:hypothetical protein
VAQKFDNLFQFRLRALGTGHVVKGRLFLPHGIKPCPAPTHREDALTLAPHATEEKVADAEEEHQRQEGDDDGGPGKVGGRFRAHLYFLLLQQG